MISLINYDFQVSVAGLGRDEIYPDGWYFTSATWIRMAT